MNSTTLANKIATMLACNHRHRVLPAATLGQSKGQPRAQAIVFDVPEGPRRSCVDRHGAFRRFVMLRERRTVLAWPF